MRNTPTFTPFSFFENPYLWVFVVAAFVAAAFVALTTVPSRRPDPAGARKAKLSFLFLWLAVAVAAATGGVITAGPQAFLSVELLYVAVGAVVVFFLAFRFPRAGGIPVAVLLVTFFITVFGALSPHDPVGEELVRLRVTDVEEGRIRLRFLNPPSLVYEGEGDFARLRFELIEVHPALLFIHPGMRYRMHSLETGSIDDSTTIRALDETVVEGLPPSPVLALMIEWGLVTLTEGESNWRRMVLLAEYVVDAGIELRRDTGP